MRWRMRIGHYEPSTTITLDDGRISLTFASEELRRDYGFPGMTDEDLFCLTFYEFSRSIKVALLDEGPLTPQEVHDRGAAVYALAREEKKRQSRERVKRRRAMDGYANDCEAMFSDWRRGELALPAGYGFSSDHAPEPYLTFGSDSLDLFGEPRLVFLTTNPGGGMREQTRSAVNDPSYAAFQARIVKTLYDTQDFKGAAAHRIRRMHEIATELFGTPDFIQCEVVPFHSGSLRYKAKLDAQIDGEEPDSLLNRYLLSLSEFLRQHHVIALDATSLLDEPSRLWNGWIRRKAELIGFDRSVAGKGYTKFSAENNESAALYHHRDRGFIRAYYLTQGTNNFGNDTKGVADAIKSDGPL